MVNWYLNRALTNFRNAVNARWPRRDKTSDGTIGDLAHQATTSQHNPDPDGSVDAWDMDVDGVDVWQCILVFERHESSGYWIFNDIIATRENGWRRQSYAYAGPNRNRHTKHVHFSTRQSMESSNAPWTFTQPEVVTMTMTSEQNNALSEVWATAVALRDGTPTHNVATAPSRPAWIITAAGRIEDTSRATHQEVVELREVIDAFGTSLQNLTAAYNDLANQPTVAIDYDLLAGAIVRAAIEHFTPGSTG